jgi:uncharacterized protein YbjT (DUF2867 family)
LPAAYRGGSGKGWTLVGPLRGVERAMLISSSDPVMLDVQSAFVDSARDAGVKHVVKLSGIMPEVDSAFRFARMHGLAERKLEDSGLAFTHLRAGEFMQSYFRQVRSIVAQSVMRLPMAEARIASIDVADIADVAVEVLTGDGHAGQTYPITGPESLTMAEVAERISAAIGKHVDYVNIAPADYLAGNLAAGLPPYTAEALVELYAERRNGKESVVYPLVQELLGRPARSFADFAERYAAVFRGEQPPPNP